MDYLFYKEEYRSRKERLNQYTQTLPELSRIVSDGVGSIQVYPVLVTLPIFMVNTLYPLIVDQSEYFRWGVSNVQYPVSDVVPVFVAE